MPLAVAVIVAVRVAGLLVPDEKVTTAFPVVSLVTELADRTPVSAEKLTVTPDTTALDPSTTVAVIVVVVLLSEATVVGDAARVIAAAVGVTVTGVVVVVDDDEDPPPPQALNMANSANTSQDENARAKDLFKRILLLRWMSDRIDLKSVACEISRRIGAIKCV